MANNDWFENKLGQQERAFNNYLKFIADKPKRKRKSFHEKFKDFFEWMRR